MNFFWTHYRRARRDALVEAGMSRHLSGTFAMLATKARMKAEPAVGRTIALAAEFRPDPFEPGQGTLWIDSHLVPKEQRSAAKAKLGLPDNY